MGIVGELYGTQGYAKATWYTMILQRGRSQVLVLGIQLL